MSNVIPFPGLSRIDKEPDTVLIEAVEANLVGIVVLGYTADGNEYFNATYADGGDVLWHLERAKLKLLGMVDVLTD